MVLRPAVSAVEREGGSWTSQCESDLTVVPRILSNYHINVFLFLLCLESCSGAPISHDSGMFIWNPRGGKPCLLSVDNDNKDNRGESYEISWLMGCGRWAKGIRIVYYCLHHSLMASLISKSHLLRKTFWGSVTPVRLHGGCWFSWNFRTKAMSHGQTELAVPCFCQL